MIEATRPHEIRQMPPQIKIARLGPRLGAALIDFILVNVICTVAALPLFYFFDFENRTRQMREVFSPEGLAKFSACNAGQMEACENLLTPDLQSQIAGVLILSCSLLLVMLILVHAYYVYFESTSGQTPGKKLFGLKVVTLTGHRITKSQAFSREMLRWFVDAVLLIPFFISVLSSVRRQRVGDRFAKTLVVEIPK